MADGDLFIHVEIEVDSQTTITVGSGTAGTIEPASTAGTINQPTAGGPE